MAQAYVTGIRVLFAFLLAAPVILSGADQAVAAAPINECGSAQNVTPSSFASATGGTGCKILVLQVGNYPKLNLVGRSGGVLTIRCAQPGACVFGTGSVVAGVNGLILDGIRITGGVNALTIKGASKNVLVRRSRFSETTNSGVLVYPGTPHENIQIHDNEFQNASLGCNYNNTDICGHLSDGTPIAEMDYGLRVYSTNTISIKGNTFGTMFNHSISLKYSVTYALIENNTFNNCGRTCINLGQDSPPCGEAVVTGNIFNRPKLPAIVVQNIRKATITGNTFIATPRPIYLGSGPSGRKVTQSPNTYR
jgi:hypothetical protein